MGLSLKSIGKAIGKAAKGVGKVVKKVAAPLAIGALAIPGAGAVVGGVIKGVGSAIGALQKKAANADSIVEAAPGTFAEAVIKGQDSVPDESAAMGTTGQVTGKIVRR